MTTTTIPTMYSRKYIEYEIKMHRSNWARKKHGEKFVHNFRFFAVHNFHAPHAGQFMQK